MYWGHLSACASITFGFRRRTALRMLLCLAHWGGGGGHSSLTLTCKKGTTQNITNLLLELSIMHLVCRALKSVGNIKVLIWQMSCSILRSLAILSNDDRVTELWRVRGRKKTSSLSFLIMPKQRTS